MLAVAIAAAGGAAAAPSRPATPAKAALPSVAGLPPIYWSGLAWTPSTGCNVNNACFRELPDTLFVDTSGRLHLRIINNNGKWWSSEISTVSANFGYGTYSWVVETPIGRLDPASVIGMFTYNGVRDANAPKGDPHVGHLEADFEVTRWRTPQNRSDLQETIQPYWNPYNIRRVPLPLWQTPLTFTFTWAPTSTTFVVRRGAGTTGPVVTKWTTSSVIGAPRPGTKVLLDFWNYEGPPLSWTSQEAVIDSFTYTPAAGGLPDGL